MEGCESRVRIGGGRSEGRGRIGRGGQEVIRSLRVTLELLTQHEPLCGGTCVLCLKVLLGSSGGCPAHPDTPAAPAVEGLEDLRGRAECGHSDCGSAIKCFSDHVPDSVSP